MVFLRILHFLQDRFGHRFWDDFCFIFGPGSEANRPTEVFERDPKKDTKKNCIWKASGSILHGFWDPAWIRGGGPRTPFWAFLALLGSLGGKMAPGCAKSASKTDFGPILVDFWSIFGQFFVVLCRRFFEFGLLSRSRSWHYVLPSCGGSLTTQSQNPFIEARWRRKPEGQLDIYILYNHIHTRTFMYIQKDGLPRNGPPFLILSS